MKNLQTIAIVSLLATTSLFSALGAEAREISLMTKFQQQTIIIVSGYAALNPQPLPPKQGTPIGDAVFSPGADVSLNPQPLPPKYFKRFTL
ncbi:MAG: hypothetical protein ACYC0C_14370 [Devosia sp.]